MAGWAGWATDGARKPDCALLLAEWRLGWAKTAASPSLPGIYSVYYEGTLEEVRDCEDCETRLDQGQAQSVVAVEAGPLTPRRCSPRGAFGQTRGPVEDHPAHAGPDWTRTRPKLVRPPAACKYRPIAMTGAALEVPPVHTCRSSVTLPSLVAPPRRTVSWSQTSRGCPYGMFVGEINGPRVFPPPSQVAQKGDLALGLEMGAPEETPGTGRTSFALRTCRDSTSCKGG